MVDVAAGHYGDDALSRAGQGRGEGDSGGAFDDEMRLPGGEADTLLGLLDADRDDLVDQFAEQRPHLVEHPGRADPVDERVLAIDGNRMAGFSAALNGAAVSTSQAMIRA